MKNLLPLILTILIAIGSCNSKNDTSGKNEINSIPLEKNSENYEAPFYQTNGIGKLVVNFEETMYKHDPYILNFYLSDSDSNLLKTVELKWNVEKNGYVELFGADFINVNDFYIDEPYYILMFNCLKESNGFYEVVVNVETQMKMWIKSKSTIEFKSWDKFLKEVVCLSAMDTQANPIRIEPNDSSDIAIQDIEDKCWDVISMKGEWIEIKCSETEFDLSEEKFKNFVGWLKWRNDNVLLIDYFLSD